MREWSSMEEERYVCTMVVFLLIAMYGTIFRKKRYHNRVKCSILLLIGGMIEKYFVIRLMKGNG